MARQSPSLVPLLLLAASHWMPWAAAQQLLTYGSGALPTCAEQCTILDTAQTGCVPPAAPVTDQATYISCFCQSGYISSLSTDASQYCGSVCSGDDLTAIQTWYSSFCASDDSAAASQPTTTTAADAATTTTPTTQDTMAATTTAASAASSSAGSTSANSSTSTVKSEPQTWWDEHWKWVMMLIIIAAGISFLAWATIFLRKRHRRRRDEMHGRFNDGVTSRSMVHVDALPAGARSVSALSQTHTNHDGSDTASSTAGKKSTGAKLKSKLMRARISEEVV